VKRLTVEGKTIPQVARDLDLTESALRQWVERIRADRTEGKTGLTTAEREELARLRKESDVEPLDRTTINAWEDVECRKAIEATRRRKLIIAALWTETCLLFPSLDAMRSGYEVFVPVDAVGGTSVLAHEAALRRLEQAGAHFTTIPSMLCELQRDWARRETVPAFVELMFKKR
jgi:nicotinamidase-related amidase